MKSVLFATALLIAPICAYAGGSGEHGSDHGGGSTPSITNNKGGTGYGGAGGNGYGGKGGNATGGTGYGGNGYGGNAAGGTGYGGNAAAAAAAAASASSASRSQASGGHATATGGSATSAGGTASAAGGYGGNSSSGPSSVSVNNAGGNYQAAANPPSPALAASGPCTGGGFSIGAAAVGAGAALNYIDNDVSCQLLKVGMTRAAIAYLCRNVSGVPQAIHDAGLLCPSEEREAEAAQRQQQIAQVGYVPAPAADGRLPITALSEAPAGANGWCYGASARERRGHPECAGVGR